MSTCLVCMNDALRGLLLQDKDECARAAHDFIQGMILTAGQSTQSHRDVFKGFQPLRRRGVGLVERCARVIEASCGGCLEDGCPRCMIAAELRSAEDRLHDEREAELAGLGADDEVLEELIDKIVGGLCKEHSAFGSALAGQWYNRQNFLSPPTSHDA